MNEQKESEKGPSDIQKKKQKEAGIHGWKFLAYMRDPSLTPPFYCRILFVKM